MNPNLIKTGVLGAALAALLTGDRPALGQSAQDKAARQREDLKVEAALRIARAGPESESKHSISLNTADDRVEVEIVNGKVTRAEHNGEAVPTDRVRLNEDGSFTFVDEDGKVIIEMRMRMELGHDVRLRLSRADDVGEHLGMWLNSMQPPGSPPDGGSRVLIGITMEQVDESAASQLGIKPAEAVLVGSVREGFPAEAAGIEPNDIIVEIAGKPASMERVREIVSSKSPGDKIDLIVLRKGERKKIETGVQQAEPEAASRLMLERALSDMDQGVYRTFVVPGLAGTLRDPNVNARMWQEDLHQALIFRERAQEQARAADHLARQLHEQMSRLYEQQQQQLPPGAAGPGGADVSRRLDDLEARLERMQVLLERIAEERGPRNRN